LVVDDARAVIGNAISELEPLDETIAESLTCGSRGECDD
jgi:hypothetical protein